MPEKSYTLLIVPERSSQVRRLKLPYKTLMRLALGGALTIGLIAFMCVHYVFVVDQASENGRLRQDNFLLRKRLRVIQEEIARVDVTLERIEEFSSKIRAITQLSDPERNLAIGPLQDSATEKPREVLFASGERTEHEDETMDSELALRLADQQLNILDTQAMRQEQRSKELHDYLREDESLLTNTPSIRPIRSKLLTSSFGVRKDIFTNQPVMHKGVDFAADEGAEVLAPADGLVVYAGRRGAGYGNTVVLDHGYGVQTHYAHLEGIDVQVGQRVRRGETLAKAGNTGRSSGPHLHYEVRFNGIPQDPERFILE